MMYSNTKFLKSWITIPKNCIAKGTQKALQRNAQQWSQKCPSTTLTIHYNKIKCKLKQIPYLDIHLSTTLLTRKIIITLYKT
jgi:hypothetical protein